MGAGHRARPADPLHPARPGGHRGGPRDARCDGFVLTARRGDTGYGICSTAFLEYAFRTESYRIEVVFNPDGSWSYVLDTMLFVHGRPEPFLHRDRNTLRKVAEPTSNPLALLRKAASKPGR